MLTGKHNIIQYGISRQACKGVLGGFKQPPPPPWFFALFARSPVRELGPQVSKIIIFFFFF